MAEVLFLPPAAKYLKKLKDANLKRRYQEAIQKIRQDSTKKKKKKGDLNGIYGYDIYYNHTNYELAYTIETATDGETIIVIMAGTRENFYDQLKKYFK